MPANDHLRRWLAQGMTGCRFASLVARDERRVVTAVLAGSPSESDVNRAFEIASAAQLPVMVMFTGIRTEAALVDQLAVLATGPRWSIAEEHPDGAVTDDVFVGVEWQVRPGLVSSVMGLGPFATMPVTRRAPYVCLAAWPGEHCNPHWTRFDAGLVHFLDTDLTHLRLDTAKYKALTQASVAATKTLLADPPDDARLYRRAAFRLSSNVAVSVRRIPRQVG